MTPQETHLAPAADADGGDSVKARQILNGARKVFMELGFDAASMNDVAREAGVSKGTIYSYFSSKVDLFSALIGEDTRLRAEQLAIYEGLKGPIEEALPRLGFALMDVILDPANVAQIRMVTAVAPRFPAIGAAFYEAGPDYGHRRLVAWLARRAGVGDLEIEDFEMAAAQFFNLIQGALFRKMLFAGQPKPSRGEIQATAEAAARVFLRAYGARRD